MKVVIVGGGASALYCALYIKKKDKDTQLTIIEQKEKVGKKIFATGNGRCNILNKTIQPESFSNPSFINNMDIEVSYDSLIRDFDYLGIPTIEEGDLVYPLTYSAANVVDILFSQCLDLGVEFKLGEKVKDYDSRRVITDKGEYEYDKLVIASGGKSQPNLGSDGSLFDILKRHNNSIKETIPALCPIKVKEKTKSISGQRHDAFVRAYENNEEIFSERGEILFKDDGLSGIVIFNASRVFKNRENITLKLDLFPDYSLDELTSLLSNLKATLGDNFLKGVLSKGLLPILSDDSSENIAKTLKDLKFTYLSNYSFRDSQITIGGVSLDNVKNTLESKLEKNIYFIGEVLDQDGPCGGFNLGWCLISAKVASKSILGF